MLATAGRRSYLAAQVAVMVAALGVAGCRPRQVEPVGRFEPASREELGAVASRTVPPGYQVLRVRWRSDDGQVSASGNGAVRVAPDSLRVDLAIKLGIGRATLILAGDSVQAEPPDIVRQLLPDRYALWAAMGVIKLPPAALAVSRLTDRGRTFWRVQDDAGRRWTYEMRGDTLDGVTRAQDGRLVARLELERGADGRVTRASATDLLKGARFEVDIVSREPSAGFPEAVWHLRS